MINRKRYKQRVKLLELKIKPKNKAKGQESKRDNVLSSEHLPRGMGGSGRITWRSERWPIVLFLAETLEKSAQGRTNP